MITPHVMSLALARTLRIIKTQTEGLSHEDALLQPPVPGNCMNWVLGHIAGTRNSALLLLGLEPILGEAQAKRYGNGSEPVCGEGEGVIRLEALLAMLEASQTAMAARLEAITPEELAEPRESFFGPTTVGGMLFFWFWHESYHVGQLEILRELAKA